MCSRTRLLMNETTGTCLGIAALVLSASAGWVGERCVFWLCEGFGFIMGAFFNLFFLPCQTD